MAAIRSQIAVTTVTHAEAGSQLPDADFWETADRVVSAHGALIAQYDASSRPGKPTRLANALLVVRGRALN